MDAEGETGRVTQEEACANSLLREDRSNERPAQRRSPFYEQPVDNHHKQKSPWSSTDRRGRRHESGNELIA